MQTDTTSILYVGKEQKGYGIKSTIRTQVTSLCRELEVTLNDPAPLHAIAARGRFKAALEGEGTIGNSGARDANYLLEAMNFIGAYGIWIRDSKYMAFNVWMNVLAEDSNLFCVGDSHNHWDYGPSLAKRHQGTSLRQFVSGGSAFNYFLEYCRQWIVRNPNGHWTYLADVDNWDIPVDWKSDKKRMP
jgi:hypothetical protein